MSYIENNLGKDEKVILKIEKSIWYLIAGCLPLVVCVILGIVLTVLIGNLGESETSNVMGSYMVYVWIGLVVIGLIPLIKRICVFLSLNLAVTNKRVIGKVGILRINTLDIHIDKIDHVQVKAGILGNIFHYYGLKVFSVGGAGMDNRKSAKDRFVGISNAQVFKNTVNNAIEQHAEEARKAQAAEIAAAMRNK